MSRDRNDEVAADIGYWRGKLFVRLRGTLFTSNAGDILVALVLQVTIVKRY